MEFFAFLLAGIGPFVVITLMPPGRSRLIGWGLVVVGIVAFAILGAPRRGSSDAAGMGLALGYHSFLIWIALLSAAAGGLVQLLRHNWPGPRGWLKVLKWLAIFLGIVGAMIAMILMQP